MQPQRQRIGNGDIGERTAKVERLDAVDQIFAHARVALGARRRRRLFIVAHGLGQLQARGRKAVLIKRVILPVHRPQRAPLHGIGQRVAAQRISEGATRGDGAIAAIAHHFGQRGQGAAVRRGLRGKVDFDDVVDRIQDHAGEVEQEVRVPHLVHRHGVRPGRDDVTRHIRDIRPPLTQQHPHVNAIGIHGFGIVDDGDLEVDHFAVGHNQAVGLQINVQVRNVRIGAGTPRDLAGVMAQVGIRHKVAGAQKARHPLFRILEIEVGRVGEAVEVFARAAQRPCHHKSAVFAQVEVVNAIPGIVLGVRRAAAGLGTEINVRDRAMGSTAITHNELGTAGVELTRHRSAREDVTRRRPLRVIEEEGRRSAAIRHQHRLGAAAGVQHQFAIHPRRLQPRGGDDGRVGRDLDAGIRRRATIIQRGLIDDGSFASHHLCRHQYRDGAFVQGKRRQAIADLGQQVGGAPLQGLAAGPRTRHAVR